jgi:hypothetical protein
MERMLYLVAPTNDQLNHDADGPVSMDLFAGELKRVQLARCPPYPDGD